MEEVLNRRAGGEGEEGLVGVDRIKVREVRVGEGYPVLSRARVRPNGEEEEGVVSLSFCLTLSPLLFFG